MDVDSTTLEHNQTYTTNRETEQDQHAQNKLPLDHFLKCVTS